MKCPKCGYLGFEDVDRCRNCGYDFSLSSGRAVTPDLPIRRDTRALTPLDDLSLIDSGGTATSARMTDAGADLDRVLGLPDAAATPPPSAAGAVQYGSSVELPLFGPPIPDDEPLITRASPPRPPLAVRRATPEVARARAGQPRAPSFDLVLDDAPSSSVTPGERAAATEWSDDRPGPSSTAGVLSRLAAVVIDLVILAAIDAAVVYFTMQICGLTAADLDILPKGPLIAFLIVQNGGYLVAFTAGGQTLGKMAAGIRVVPADPDMTIDLGRAFLRTLMWVLLAIPAGLGFLPAIVSRDHRGLHDRFAGTRVVRATL
jgi:uncharacterized RDD family membrane protein YckC